MFSQIPSILLLSKDTTFKSHDGLLLVNGSGALGSNALDNQFFRKSILGGKLENAHLNALDKSMKNQNRAGAMAMAGIELWNFRDTLFNRPEWGFKVAVSTNYHTALSFSKDLYDLIYRGNARFAGDTAYPGPLSFQNQSWQKFGVGFFNKKTLSGFTLSLVEGQSYQSLIVGQSQFYTSPLGDSLALTYRGDYMRSDTSRKGMANGSGVGIALDFDYNLPLNDNQGVISISIRDFGFVSWNKESESMSFDSLNTWTGLDVNNLFALSTDTLNFPNLEDSVHYTTVAKRFVAPLPASIMLRYCRYINDRDYCEAGLTMWPNRAAVPLIYAGLSHFVGQHFVFSERISFGGYGRWGLGAEMQWMPAGTWLLRMGSNNLGGWTMGSAKGVDVFFGIGKSF